MEYASIEEWTNGPMNSLKDTRVESKTFIDVLSVDRGPVDTRTAQLFTQKAITQLILLPTAPHRAS